MGDILDVTNAADIKLREAGLRPNTAMNFQDDLQVSIFYPCSLVFVYYINVKITGLFVGSCG